jgi:hypothetical protein
MQRRAIVSRLITLPLRHKLLAAAISLVMIAGSLVLTLRHPREYVSSAVLSFDESAGVHPVLPGVKVGRKSAKDLAESILNGDALKVAPTQLAFFPEDSPNSQMAQPRAHLTIMEISTSKLRVTWRGREAGQTLAVTNAVADLLASWVPRDSGTLHPSDSTTLSSSATLTTATKPTPRIVGIQGNINQMRVRHQTLLEEERQVQSQLDKTETRLTTLEGEQRRLEGNIQPTKSEGQRAMTARQRLNTQLSAVKKNLEDLRARYTDEYPDVQAAQERVAQVETELATLPAERALPEADQPRPDAIAKEISDLRGDRRRLLQSFQDDETLDKNLRDQEETLEHSAQPETQEHMAIPSSLSLGKPEQALGHREASNARFKNSIEPVKERKSPFSILERAEVAQPIDSVQLRPIWLGSTAGVLSGILYLTLALWWFRAVQSLAALERIVPGEVAYVGAIPRMIR